MASANTARTDEISGEGAVKSNILFIFALGIGFAMAWSFHFIGKKLAFAIYSKRSGNLAVERTTKE